MTRLSNRQYPMLQEFATGHLMSIERAQTYDQRPFRSMLIQEWIAYTGQGFRITDKGREAWREFQSTEIWRKDPRKPLTSYFDPSVYGLKLVKKSAA